jgi:hypothetical protein
MLEIKAKGKTLQIDTDVFRLACSRTLRRMGQRIKTESSSMIRDRYNINKNKVDPQMTLVPPSVKKLQVMLKVSSTRMFVEDFGPRYPASPRSQRKAPGVSVEIIRGQRKVIRVPVNGRLIGTFRKAIKGAPSVFVRIGVSRQLRAVTTIGVVDMFRSAVVQTELDKFVEETLPVELEHEVDFALSQQSSTANG